MGAMPGKRSGFRPNAEVCEPRCLLSAGVLHLAGGAHHPERPNTPVLPYGAPSKQATFLDPSSRIVAPNRIAFGANVFVAPFAGLDATQGYIKVGASSVLLDNSTLVANPNRTSGNPGIEIGDQTVIGFGARVEGNSRIGAYDAASKPTSIGANALVQNSIIEPGAIVDVGATVTNVTVPTGLRVLPGAVVTTQAEASEVALKKVVPVTKADLSAITTTVSDAVLLASGYTTLYQGQSNTGVAGSPASSTTVANLFNGNLAQVRGTSAEPSTTIQSTRYKPRFLANNGKTIAAGFADFPARITGQVIIRQKAGNFANRVGTRVAIRADEGQPIRIQSIARLGSGVTLHAQRGGNLTIGSGFRAKAGAVIQGGKGSTVGNDVSVGSRAVVERSNLGNGVIVGDGALIIDSTIAAGTVVPAGAIIVANKRV